MRGTNRPRTLPKKLKGSPSNRQCSMALPRCRTKGQLEYKRMLAWPVQRRITAGYVTGDYDPQLPLVRHLHASGVRRDSTQSSGHDNGNVHRAAAKIIVSKSRAARGSVCNVLLSVDCPESISLEAVEVRFQLGDVIGFSISPVKFIRPAKNRILVLHNPLDKSIGAETTRSKNAK